MSDVEDLCNHLHPPSPSPDGRGWCVTCERWHDPMDWGDGCVDADAPAALVRFDRELSEAEIEEFATRFRAAMASGRPPTVLGRPLKISRRAPTSRWQRLKAWWRG